MTLLQQMKDSRKLNIFPDFFFSHPMCQLLTNNFPTTENKGSLIFGMLTHFGIILILFFDIRSHIPISLLTTYMITKKNPPYEQVICSSFLY
jgi:hypothetical protein